MRKIFIILLLGNLFASQSSIAVIDFESINLRQTDANALTQRLTTELINLDKYTVLERSLIQQIIEEQKFQYSGNVNRTDAVEMLAGSKDGFISYYKAFQDVHKIYTLYSSFPMALSIVEIQTQLYSGHPQVRTFIGSCK